MVHWRQNSPLVLVCGIRHVIYFQYAMAKQALPKGKPSKEKGTCHRGQARQIPLAVFCFFKFTFTIESITAVPCLSPLTPSSPSYPHAYCTIVCVPGLCISAYKFFGYSLPLTPAFSLRLTSLWKVQLSGEDRWKRPLAPKAIGLIRFIISHHILRAS